MSSRGERTIPVIGWAILTIRPDCDGAGKNTFNYAPEDVPQNSGWHAFLASCVVLCDQVRSSLMLTLSTAL